MWCGKLTVLSSTFLGDEAMQCRQSSYSWSESRETRPTLSESFLVGEGEIECVVAKVWRRNRHKEIVSVKKNRDRE